MQTVNTIKNEVWFHENMQDYDFNIFAQPAFWCLRGWHTLYLFIPAWGHVAAAENTQYISDIDFHSLVCLTAFPRLAVVVRSGEAR